MPAIKQIVPNLMGGVSQQPDPMKIPGQVRDAENVYLDPTFGCKKRPPTRFISNIDSGNIPEDAKWFTIFRDSNERYIAVVYRDENTGTKMRVWEADTGTERTVNIRGAALDYITVSDNKNLRNLTINDYTLLVNSEKEVVMDTNLSPGSENNEALVVVNQVAYNTSYNVDFLKDGTLSQEKVWRAAKLSVSPASFEVDDEGTCDLADTQSYVEDIGAKTGLGFTLRTRCNPTLETEETPGAIYPVSLQNVTEGYAGFTYYAQAWATLRFGSADNYVRGSYIYHTFTNSKPPGDITVRVEVRIDQGPDFGGVGHNKFTVVKAEIVQYTINDDGPAWNTNTHVADFETLSSDLDRYPPYGLMIPAGSTVGVRFRVSNVRQGDDVPEYSYISKYKTDVTLQNGGTGFRKGDSVTVTMSGKQYTVTVTEETFGYAYVAEASASYTTPVDTSNGVLDVGTIVASLVTDINNLGDYTATPIGNVIHIIRTDGRQFNIQTRGGVADTAIEGIKGAVNDLSVLPQQCVSGVVLKVRNSADSAADDYYVRFESSEGDIPGQGSWEETVAPNIPTDINPNTMPHALIREADGTFTLRPLSEDEDEELYWKGRQVGDEESNPQPSFVGQSIRDMFFYSNRLGVLTSDSVVMSQPGDFFNFFQTSAIAVSDADPIDMTASSTKPATLKSAIGTSRGLLLFAENSQFVMSTQDQVFGPATVEMKEIANYSFNTKLPILDTGVSVIFATEADTYTKVFEMAVDSIDNRPLVSENTRIIPEYIPPGLEGSAVSPNNSFVMFTNGTKDIYTFKFFNVGNERQVAGWSKWTMPCDVKLVDFDNDTGYMVLYNNPFENDDPPADFVTGSNYFIVRFEMLDDPNTSPINVGGKKFSPRLDNYLLPQDVTTEIVDGDTTRLRFPEGSYVEGTQPNVIVTVDGEATLFTTPELQDDETGYYVDISADIVDAPYILGLQYNMKVELPSFFVQASERTDRTALPMVEFCYIDLYFSGRYQVTVDKLGYEPYTIDLDVTRADLYNANSPAVQEIGTRAIPVFSRGDVARISISTPDPLPSAITGYSWEGHYNTRGIRTIG